MMFHAMVQLSSDSQNFILILVLAKKHQKMRRQTSSQVPEMGKNKKQNKRHPLDMLIYKAQHKMKWIRLIKANIKCTCI